MFDKNKNKVNNIYHHASHVWDHFIHYALIEAMNKGEVMAETTQAEPQFPRLRINMNQETADALREMMENTGHSATEITRRALSIYYLLWNIQRKGGLILYRRRANRRRTERELVLLD